MAASFRLRVLGLRPAVAQHTAAEHEAFRKWAEGRECVVEIGVAEGVSALALREGMAEDGTLYLIDPFHLSRLPALNFIKRVARRTVGGSSRGRVVWIEKFSQDAVRDWKEVHRFDFDRWRSRGGCRGARLAGLEPFCETRRRSDLSRCENFRGRLDDNGFRAGEIC